MSKIEIDEDFKNRLLSSYQIDAPQLEQLLDELGEYFSYEVKDFIPIRHQELQRAGLKNEQIYQQIQKELKAYRFIGPCLSLRQIRRIIYG